jgi:dihydropyrimidinase
MKPNRFWIRNAVVASGDGFRAADVCIEGERIAAVDAPGAAPPLTPQDIDAAGLWLLPGGVDVHTHFGMPLRDGIASRGWRPSSLDALRGGTTTIIDFANPEPGESLHDAVARWRGRAEAGSGVDYGLHVTVPEPRPERLDEIPDLVAAGLPTFKAFLAYKGRLMLTNEELARVLRHVTAAGGGLLLHAEDGEWNDRVLHDLLARGATGPEHHPAAHPAGSEVAAIRDAAELVRVQGGSLTIVHLSTGAGLEAIRAARARGADIRAETCPQYLFRDEAWYSEGDTAALIAAFSPPLRSRPDNARLLQGLETGAIDWIATDHCAFPLELKRREAAQGFHRVPNGAAGVGERLRVVYTLAVRSGRITPERWIRLCCEAPADAMGLNGRKGRIAPGYDADLVLFDPDAEPTPWPDSEPSLWSDSAWAGAVRDVWLRGEPALREGAPVDPAPAGRFLPRFF